MIKFYLGGGPNPRKVALFLEEAGIEYEAIWVNVTRGEQHSPAFSRLNPNCKIPVIVDDDAVIFDSSAILLYLADKHGRFVPPRGTLEWAELLSWLMFIASGVGPYSGQAVHFQHASPEEQPYAINRYLFEAQRHFSIVEQRLEGRDWLVGEQLSIADMALWGWASFLPRVIGEESAAEFANVNAHTARINALPAARRAVASTTRSGGAPPDVHANPHLFRYLASEPG